LCPVLLFRQALLFFLKDALFLFVREFHIGPLKPTV
jgi:hypothetical protein